MLTVSSLALFFKYFTQLCKTLEEKKSNLELGFVRSSNNKYHFLTFSFWLSPQVRSGESFRTKRLIAQWQMDWRDREIRHRHCNYHNRKTIAKMAMKPVMNKDGMHLKLLPLETKETVVASWFCWLPDDF